MLLLVVTVVMLLGAAIFVHSMFVGAPFLPSKDRYIEQSLDMLGLQAGQHLLELGSGDGRVLVAAAKRGIHATGYEINPLLFSYSWLRSRRYHALITLKFGNYWSKPLPEADGIYVFLLQPYMAKLDAKLTAEIHKPTKLLSYVFRIPGKKPILQAEGIYLYDYS